MNLGDMITLISFYCLELESHANSQISELIEKEQRNSM